MKVKIINKDSIMKYFSFMIFIMTLAFAYAKNNTTFINQHEYGKKLYANPRGIGCIQCHGKNGEGGVIGYIIQNGKRKEIMAPKIKGVTFTKFEDSLQYSKGLMPRYYLTLEEILAIYSFLNPEILNENND